MSAVESEVRRRVPERELWRRVAGDRDQAARAELVELYMPLARRMASRYAGVSEPYDDLLQVAGLGLLNAVDRFDASRGTPFAGFAKPTILGELKRYFRDKVWTVRVPRSIHDRMGEVERATEKLTLELRRPPSVDELAAEVGIEAPEVLEVLEARHNRRPLSLDAPPSGEDPEDASGAEWVGRPDGNYDLVEDRIVVEAVLPTLEEREREVLRLRFVEELPQTEIALRIGCSQMHISRLLRRALDKLREEAEG
ncbi:MAG TPA: SigB/SigF/SigG family RNA polymerase sigma factor [Solirubrobacterales bacterium]|nr:SigB/SigF/SigG family RNA polymerase sigma factor [Solirubrobacterales bacterium]